VLFHKHSAKHQRTKFFEKKKDKLALSLADLIYRSRNKAALNPRHLLSRSSGAADHHQHAIRQSRPGEVASLPPRDKPGRYSAAAVFARDQHVA